MCIFTCLFLRQILGTPSARASLGHDAILLLTLLVQYRKYEVCTDMYRLLWIKSEICERVNVAVNQKKKKNEKERNTALKIC